MPDSSTETIRCLKALGVKTALVSNADVLEKEAWPLCPAAPHFDSVIFSCDVGFMKPEPEIYGLALKELGEPPEACVFVGDGGSDELRAAKSLGMATVLIYGYVEKLWPDLLEERKQYADHAVKYVDELVP
jgi:putative hydrolase of the HAD superfamily